MTTETITEWLAQMGFAPTVGAVIIAAVTIAAAAGVRFVGDKVALGLSRWSRLGIRTQLFDIIRGPLWVTVILAGALAEIQWLTPPAPVDFLVRGTALSGLAIIWMIALGRTLGLISSRLSGYYPDAGELFRLSENVGVFAIAAIGGLMIMGIWQINLTPLLASAGLIGIIVGLAAKDTLGNFFGGISVFLDKPFKRGDWIVLKPGERGKVIDIGLRSTRILTRDDVLITIPNSAIANSKIINESAPKRRMRVRVKISVLQGSDPDKVQEALLKIAEENDLVLSEPKPRVRFRGFGDTAFDFELLCWTANPKDKGRLIHQLNTAAVKEFIRSEISLVTPQRELFLYKSPNMGSVPKEERTDDVDDEEQAEQPKAIPFNARAKNQTEQRTERTEAPGP